MFTNEELLLLKKIIDKSLLNGSLVTDEAVALSKKINKEIKE